MVDGVEKKVFLKKRWRIATTHPGVATVLAPLRDVPSSIPKEDFVQCRGKFAKASPPEAPSRVTPCFFRFGKSILDLEQEFGRIVFPTHPGTVFSAGIGSPSGGGHWRVRENIETKGLDQ